MAEEDKGRAVAVAMATAAAAEAAAAAAHAAAKVVQLAGIRRHSREDQAATIIQSAYRGYLVCHHPYPVPCGLDAISRSIKFMNYKPNLPFI